MARSVRNRPCPNPPCDRGQLSASDPFDPSLLTPNAYAVGQVGHDDIADAFAALWTAERKLLGQAIPIPANPPVDQLGLRMEIWR